MRFLDSAAPQHLAAVWIVRLLMAGILLFTLRSQRTGKDVFRLVSMLAVTGLFGKREAVP